MSYPTKPASGAVPTIKRLVELFGPELAKLGIQYMRGQYAPPSTNKAPPMVLTSPGPVLTQRRARRRRQRRAPPGPSGTQLISTPADISMRVQGNTARFVPLSNLAVDASREGAIRVTGRALLPWDVKSGATTSVNDCLFASAQLWSGLVIKPAYCLGAAASMQRGYSWYRFLSVSVRYIPYCGSDTHGALALSVNDNSLLAGNQLTTAISPASVLANSGASLSPVWTPSVVSYRYNGAKLFSTTGTPGSARLLEREQVFLLAALTSFQDVNTGFGQLVLDYDLEYYGPTYQPSSPWTSPVIEEGAESGKEEEVVVVSPAHGCGDDSSSSKSGAPERRFRIHF